MYNTNNNAAESQFHQYNYEMYRLETKEVRIKRTADVRRRGGTCLGAECSEDGRDRGGEEVLPTTRLHKIRDESDRSVRVSGVETMHETWFSSICANNRVKPGGRVDLVEEEPESA